MSSLFRKLPAIEALLQQHDFTLLLEQHPRSLVIQTAQRRLSELRSEIKSGVDESTLEQHVADLATDVRQNLRSLTSPTLRRVINATGVIIHTNLGRSPLSTEAVEFMREVSTGYCNLEFDLETGQRSHREIHLERILHELTGARVAAAVVNNNAAAVLLILDTLASGGEVIVSRGELVEIGGSFRIPEILEKSGATLREVGTTNKTRAADYKNAINPSTRLILRVHPSNFHIVGFTERPSLPELAEVAQSHNLPLVEDLGSGLLCDARQTLGSEPTIRESLTGGADMVCFSGDKLLGATQAGIVLGKPDWIRLLRKNPLMRALRLDKTGYAALLYSFHLHLNERWQELPVFRLLSEPAERIRDRALKLMNDVNNHECRLCETSSLVGGGSAPDTSIPTVALAVTPNGRSSEELLRYLRRYTPPIVARIEHEQVLFDLRTVDPEDDAIIGAALRQFSASVSAEL